MNIYRIIVNGLARVRDLYQLYRIHKNIEIIKPERHTLNGVLQWKGSYKKLPKDAWRRKLYVSIVKQIRARFPYSPEDFSEAKEMYEAYFKMDGHIPSYEHLFSQVKSKEEVYIVNFRYEAPVKGERFAAYHMNSSGNGTGAIFYLKNVTIREKYKYINMHSPRGFYNESGVSESFFTNYRYATQSEISTFKNFEKRVAAADKEMDQLQERQKELYIELDSYENSRARITRS